MRKIMLAMILLFVSFGLSAADSLGSIFEKVDSLYEEERYEEAAELLGQAESLAKSDAEKAALYWRQARSVLNLADEAERKGADPDTLLAEYEKGEALAQKAVDLDPADHNGYYWRASNVGRWGQTKGILNSLMKAAPMRDDLEIAVRKNPDHADSFYVLGMLYASVPKLISFGNIEWAVSYSRRALDAYTGEKTKYSYYLKLGEHLQQRDWSASRRIREAGGFESSFKKASDPVEKYRYFEGVFDFDAPQPYSPGGVAKLSDREEAVKIMEWLVDELGSIDRPTSGEKDNLADARSHLAEW
jgi:tetratricopeptide (TPR) repeat protein